MTIRTRPEALEVFRARPRFAGLASVLALALASCLATTRASASDRGGDPLGTGVKYCSSTARAVFVACQYQVQDDHLIAVAKCINLSDDSPRADCLARAEAQRIEDRLLCRKQRVARQNVCAALGESRYDPDLDPAHFDDPRNPTHPNPYFPLKIGNRWEYAGGTETDTLEVLDETKLIEGLNCIVVQDVVRDRGRIAENTDDWYCQAKNGGVHYLGEEVKDYDTFQGDEPATPELVSNDGSFKSGVNGDKGGIIFLASPQVGDVYYEEFSLGNAEDVSQVLSTTYAFGSDPELDRFVPRQLAELLCADDCVVTQNTSQLEPGVVGRKYYTRGIGIFLEVNPNTGEVSQLVDCNFDSRCAGLPSP